MATRTQKITERSEKIAKKTEYVNETLHLFDQYQSDQREFWAEGARENDNFRYGNQWTGEQIKTLISRGQIPVVINRIDPAVELAKSVLCANNPTFRFVGADDSDNQVAQALNGLAEYIVRISNGRMEISDMVDDFLVKGMGGLQVYIDRYADHGKGDVKFKKINPMDVYVDPSARDRYAQDASTIIVSREYTKQHLLQLMPEFKDQIKKAEGGIGRDAVYADAEGTADVLFSGDETFETEESVRGYERYEKIWVNRFSIYEKWSGREMVFDEEQLAEYYQKPCWIINSEELIVEENEAQERAAEELQRYQQELQQYNQLLQQAEQNPEIAEQIIKEQMPAPEEPTIVKTTLQDVKDNAETPQIEEVIIPVKRVRVAFILGEALIYEKVLPTPDYPIILFMNKFTGTPFPSSDVELVKDQQRFINKMKSLIIAHASAATNVKVMVPVGTDIDQIREQWGKPNAVIEYAPSEGVPITAQPLPLPNELYTNVNQAKEDIDFQFGLFEAMHGNVESSHETARGMMMLDEFGHRRIQNKKDILENGLERLGKVILSYIQYFYKAPKIFRLLKPNNSITEFAINKRLYDDAGQFTGVIENNVALGQYDVYVEGGSMLPTNKYAQLEIYMQAYEKGIIDNEEVLKKTDIFDKEGVLKRTSIIEQQKAMIEEMEAKIKELEGNLQTRERELFHSKMDGEVQKHSNKAKDATLDYEIDRKLKEGEIALKVKAAAQAAELEKDRIIMEERAKSKERQAKK